MEHKYLQNTQLFFKLLIHTILGTSIALIRNLPQHLQKSIETSRLPAIYLSEEMINIIKT